MKTVGHAYTSNLNQIPFPNNPPPFKPLKDTSFPIYGPPSHPSSSSSYSGSKTPPTEYGPPNLYSSSLDHSGFSSSDKHESFVVDPKAYDAYHTMKKRRLANPKATAETILGPVTLNIVDNNKNINSNSNNIRGLEIQKSIEYEIKSWKGISFTEDAHTKKKKLERLENFFFCC